MENTIRWGRVMKNDGILFSCCWLLKNDVISWRLAEWGRVCQKKLLGKQVCSRVTTSCHTKISENYTGQVLSCKNPDFQVQYKGISIFIDFFRTNRSIHLYVCWLINWFWQPPGSQHLRRSTTSRQRGMNSAPKLSQSKFDSSIGRCSWGLDCFRIGRCFFCVDSHEICNLLSLSLSVCTA